MTSPGGTGPTLSQVRTWDTEHLLAAATHWTDTATVWEHHFSHFATQISFPGGELWEGEAAEAAQQMAHSDKMIVIALADQLHSASEIAKAGEREISEARRGVLKIVEAAEEAGYTVGEDFSVTDPNFYDRMTAAARQAHAEAIATSLRAAVGTLVASDVRVADELLSSTTGLGSNVFPEEEDGPTPGSIGDTIQLVNSYKKDGGPTPAAAPSPSHDSSIAVDLEKLEPYGPQGDVIEKTSEHAKSHSSGRAADAFDGVSKIGKYMGRLGVVGELWSGGKEFAAKRDDGESVKDAAIDVVPKTLSSIGGSWLGTTVGAANGAVGGAALTGQWDDVPLVGKDAAKVIGGVLGAGAGAFGGGQLGGDIGEKLGESLSETLHKVFD